MAKAWYAAGERHQIRSPAKIQLDTSVNPNHNQMDFKLREVVIQHDEIILTISLDAIHKAPCLPLSYNASQNLPPSLSRSLPLSCPSAFYS